MEQGTARESAIAAAGSPGGPGRAVAGRSVPAKFLLALAMVVCAVSVVLSPTSAYALEVSSCTAKPNAESGNGIMGATNTRINWEGQAADDEVVTALSFTLPDGTDYSLDDLKVTMLSGDDLMTRTVLDVEAASYGQTVDIAIADELPAGAYIRVEIYDVYFPRDGGEMQIEGTYTLDDGQVVPMEGVPMIEVEGITVAEQLSQWLEEQEWVQAWNSVRALHMFLDPTLIVTSLPVVFKGFLMALGIVACAFPLAIPFGFLLSLMRMSRFAVLRGIASVYVNVVRGTPLFLQIYVAFFGLPLAGIQIPNFPLGVIVLSMNSCAYMCEIFRAGIQSIPAGQFEAARSLGMTGAQTMMSVIIPQTVRRVIPTLTSEFILLYKDTSMLAAVGILEIVMYAKTIVASTGSITPYIVAALFYLVITLPLAWLVGKLENKLAGADSGSSKPKDKKKGGDAVPDSAAVPEAKGASSAGMAAVAHVRAAGAAMVGSVAGDLSEAAHAVMGFFGKVAAVCAPVAGGALGKTAEQPAGIGASALGRVPMPAAAVGPDAAALAADGESHPVSSAADRKGGETAARNGSGPAVLEGGGPAVQVRKMDGCVDGAAAGICDRVGMGADAGGAGHRLQPGRGRLRNSVSRLRLAAPGRGSPGGPRHRACSPSGPSGSRQEGRIGMATPVCFGCGRSL